MQNGYSIKFLNSISSDKLKGVSKNIVGIISNLKREFKNENLDIEFAVDRGGKFYILQVRSINNIPKVNKKIFYTFKTLDKKLKKKP